jgi:hypothetical protein
MVCAQKMCLLGIFCIKAVHLSPFRCPILKWGKRVISGKNSFCFPYTCLAKSANGSMIVRWQPPLNPQMPCLDRKVCIAGASDFLPDLRSTSNMPTFKRSALCATAVLAALAHAPSAFAGISVSRMATQPLSEELIEVVNKDREAQRKEVEVKKADAPVVNKTPVAPVAPAAPVMAKPAVPAHVAVPVAAPVAISLEAQGLPKEITLPQGMPKEIRKDQQERTWTVVPSDLRLANTIDRWAKEAGMRLVWDAKKHVLISTSDSFNGTLKDALTRVLGSPAIRKSAYPLEACIYPNTPPVIRITRLGEQAEECPQ